MSVEADPEEAVRAYLRAVVAGAVEGPPRATAGAPARSTDDPVEQLRALADLDRGRAAELEVLRRGFVRHARRWALDNDIPRATFRRLGVDEAVLEAAGVGVEGRRRGALARGAPSIGRGRPTTAEEIKDHVRARTGRFTGLDVAAEVGGSPMTIRKALNELIADGAIERLGPDPDHHELGRAPIVYETRAGHTAAR